MDLKQHFLVSLRKNNFIYYYFRPVVHVNSVFLKADWYYLISHLVKKLRKKYLRFLIAIESCLFLLIPPKRNYPATFC